MREKWRFRQFISQNVRETARFFAVFAYFGRLGRLILFNFYDPLHHHPWTGRSPHQ
jgi:hypothetical protein